VRRSAHALVTIESLAGRLALCYRNADRVAIVGGNTLHGMGLPPDPASIAISTLDLDALVEDAPSDLTIAVQCGMRVRALAQLLARHGAFVPLDAPIPSDATVGGTLAAGWLGPRRHLYGRPRDHLIGSVAVLADGTIVRAGGMVVKNVTGYDMSRLYVGSFGTLAVLVQANFKTLVHPGRTRAFLMRLPEGTRSRAIAQCGSLSIPPSAAFWISGFHGAVDGDDGLEGRMLVLVETSAQLMERATREVRSAFGRAGVPETRIVDAGAREAFERVVDAYIASAGERSITYRVNAFADDALERFTALRAIAERFELRTDTIVDVMNGDVIFRVSDLDAHALAAKIEMFDDALHDVEPAATVIAGNHPSRVLLRVWGEDPDGLAYMRSLKARFDPKNILNPGRFVGGI
jgi:glycolate oxidase FAD binding subunit